MPQLLEDLAQRVADVVAGIPGVVGVTLGGSVASGLADERSDVDLHVYWRESLAAPGERAAQLADIADPESVTVNILTWGLEDHLRIGGQLIELVYVQFDELQAEIERAYGEGLISEAYTTARLYYLVSSEVLSDSAGELAPLRTRLHHAYPEPTRRLLLRHHPELLRFGLANIRKGQQRGDMPWVLQVRTGVQAIYFNLLFALNRRYHPGEKRLLIHAADFAVLPPNFVERWNTVARASADEPVLADMLESLIHELLQLVETHQ